MPTKWSRSHIQRPSASYRAVIGRRAWKPLCDTLTEPTVRAHKGASAPNANERIKHTHKRTLSRNRAADTNSNTQTRTSHVILPAAGAAVRLSRKRILRYSCVVLHVFVAVCWRWLGCVDAVHGKRTGWLGVRTNRSHDTEQNKITEPFRATTL